MSNPRDPRSAAPGDSPPPPPGVTLELDVSDFDAGLEPAVPDDQREPAAGDVQPGVPSPSGKWKQLAVFRQRHAVAESVAFFLLGFVFDVVTLGRIDDVVTLVQQAVYLAILCGLLLFEERCRLRGPPERGVGAKLWTVSESALHFLFGSLLSTATLFFFKSASGLTALAFLAVMLALLVANELPHFRRLGPVVRLALFAFCLTAYLSYVIPILAGFLSAWLYLGAVGGASLLLWLLYKPIRAWSPPEVSPFRHAALPMGIVQVLLLGFYFLGVIPPVPLSVQQMGIYHAVEKRDGQYLLSSEGGGSWNPLSGWSIFKVGDRVFHARDGDKVYVFVRIFAPSRFRDRVFVRFSYDDPKTGWTRTPDRIPLLITGGREEGFRGYAAKGNYTPGDWRVAVETDDGRTVGVMRFRIDRDEDPASERVFVIEQG